MARSVADVAWLDGLLAKDRLHMPNVSLKGLRLGIPRGDFFEGADPQVLPVNEQALDTLVDEGGVRVKLEVHDLKQHNDAMGPALGRYRITTLPRRPPSVTRQPRQPVLPQ